MNKYPCAQILFFGLFPAYVKTKDLNFSLLEYDAVYSELF